MRLQSISIKLAGVDTVVTEWVEHQSNTTHATPSEIGRILMQCELHQIHPIDFIKRQDELIEQTKKYIYGL